jgi:hypothetical protein
MNSTPRSPHADAANVMRQALAGMLWSKQFFYYDVNRWLEERDSDPYHRSGKRAPRHEQWHHMYNADIISMPDKSEYPSYAVWDLAFHILPLTLVDVDFGKKQLDLMLSENYLHPNGQIPAYEWNFGDVNPPVHPWAMYQAAAVITFLSPGLRFFHQGQFEGQLKRISPHLGRAPAQEVNRPLKQFYERLLDVLRRPAVRQGQWQLLECVPAWDGNGLSDAFIACTWQDSGGGRLLVAVNYAGHSSQCCVRFPFPDLGGSRWRLRDLLSDAHYERDGDDLQSRGLYLDLPPWQYYAFELTAARG